jgi:hypothetical protein
LRVSSTSLEPFPKLVEQARRKQADRIAQEEAERREQQEEDEFWNLNSGGLNHGLALRSGTQLAARPTAKPAAKPATKPAAKATRKRQHESDEIEDRTEHRPQR